MKSENFQFLEVKFSIYLNRQVFVMVRLNCYCFLKSLGKVKPLNFKISLMRLHR